VSVSFGSCPLPKNRTNAVRIGFSRTAPSGGGDSIGALGAGATAQPATMAAIDAAKQARRGRCIARVSFI
jgi:hypothetical protein